MDSQQFREFGKAAIDLMADYYDTIRTRDVLPSVEPGYLLKLLPENAPEEPESWKDVLNDFSQSIMPGMSSPACTELEVVTMNWLGKLLGLPEEFLNCSDGPGGGVIQGSASEATLVGLLVAKNKTVHRLMRNDPTLNEGELNAKLVAYTSDQCNSSVEKSGLLGSMKMRLLKSDPEGRLRGETLKNAFEEDRAKGLIPCYVIANLGTTGTCAFDPLYELGPVCNESDVWLHVDAAYAGAAFICPEFRGLMKGVEYADSFDFNPHKWMLVNFDCSAMWVKNGYDLINTFDIQRIYLDDVKTDIKIPDYRHWQIPLGRRFRALKLWTVLRIYGAEGIRNHLRNQISLAQHFAKLVREDDRFLVEPEPSMGLVCFRLKDGDIVTKKLLENLTEKKQIYMKNSVPCNNIIMVYLHFPSNLTEEELMLQAKYQKLKKKKKALQALKAPKQEPEKPVLPKRPTEARDAREIARKLIKSGAIQAIKSPPPQPQNASFKRPRAGRERKLSGSAGAAGGVASYQPFSASQEPPPPEEKPAPRVKYLYDSFVTALDKEEKGPRNAPGSETPATSGPPNAVRSSTIQVAGTGITEEVLRRRLLTYEPFTFAQEGDEEKVFLTFDTPEIASHAITALDGNEEGWKATPARRPPPPAGSWTPAASPRNPPPPKDPKRTLLTYDDIFD
ncbi:hypothetical protein MSG28_015722 [Choristoneura fumiferana]|uniref:Uncharacterized protein n=2 Tax=Choristoneura fumiferana TaxID=7141 RepID=A0ACC0KBC5_CHOFU|nr:hypothetical protein MSG28_015722 [Choristoneura fumiferana]